MVFDMGLFKRLMLYIEIIKYRKEGLPNENYHIGMEAMFSSRVLTERLYANQKLVVDCAFNKW